MRYLLAAPLPILVLALVHCSSDPTGGSLGPADGGAGGALPGDPVDAGARGDAGDAGADGLTAGPPTEGAGARLVPQYFETELADGTVTRSFFGFWDRKLATTCTVATHADGDARCLPERLLGPGSAQPAEAVFKDAACTQVAALVSSGDTSAYVLAPQNAECAVRFGVHTIGAVASSQVYFRKIGSTCQEQAAATSPVALRDVAPPMAASELVSFQQREETAVFPERTPGTFVRPVAIRSVGDDGSFVSAAPALRDVRFGTDSYPTYDASSVLRFMPSVANLRTSSFFGDVGCATPLSSVYDGCKAALPLVSSTATNGDRCPSLRVFTRKPGADVATTYVKAGNVCSLQPVVDANERFFPQSSFEELPASTFPAAAISVTAYLPPGNKLGTRLQQRAELFTSQDGLVMRNRQIVLLHDPVFDQRCLVFGKSPMRCMPYTRPALFQDAACTKVVATFTKTGGCDIGEKAATLYNLVPQKIARRPATVPLQAPLTLYRASGAACVPANDVDASAFDYHPIADADLVPLESAVAVTRQELVPKF
jgi:hypothetical protein